MCCWFSSWEPYCFAFMILFSLRSHSTLFLVVPHSHRLIQKHVCLRITFLPIFKLFPCVLWPYNPIACFFNSMPISYRLKNFCILGLDWSVGIIFRYRWSELCGEILRLGKVSYSPVNTGSPDWSQRCAIDWTPFVICGFLISPLLLTN